MTVDRTAFVVHHAAEMVLLKHEHWYDAPTSINLRAFQTARWMAIELLAALLYIDAAPAETQLDEAITKIVYSTMYHGRLPPPTPGDAATVDELEAAGLDPTGRIHP